MPHWRILLGEGGFGVNPRLVIAIDAWVGRPLCAALTLARRVIAPLRALRPAPAAPGKILFVKFEEQGALVLAWDAFRRAEALVGRENLYFCLFEKNRPILDLLGFFPPENVLTIDTRSPFHALRGVLRVLGTVRARSIDTVIDFEGFARVSALLCFLTGAPRRVGLHRHTNETPYRGDLFTHRVAYSPYIHAAQGFSLLVEAAAQAPGPAPMLKIAPPALAGFPPRFDVTPAEQAALARRLPPGGDGLPAAPLFVFTPNSADILRLRKWDIANYAVLGLALRAAWPGCGIVLTGLATEHAACAELRAELGPGTTNLAGELSLRELCTLFTLCDVLVTNDSGPGHFATMTETHQVVLFGPEIPTLYGPIGPRVQVLYHALACSPCLTAYNHRRSPCRDNVCIQQITVEEVLAAIQNALSERMQSGALGRALRAERED